MSPGVDDYLAWNPADLSAAARWLSEKSTDVEMSAKAIRRDADAGTAGQCGQLITSRRAEAADIASRINRLAEVLREAGEHIEVAARALQPAVAGLREADLAMREAGFERTREDSVKDSRSTYDDAAERQQREAEARFHAEQISQFLDAIRVADDHANRALHEVVDRDVRDRTARGNGAPSEVFGELWSLRGDHTTVPTALASTGIEVLQEVQDRFADSRGISLGWWNAARGGGPLLSVLGFAGAVANAPDDEPISETLWAEGAGTVAAAVGSAVGFGLGGGPNPFGFGGHFLGGVTASQAASSYVREKFDRAN